MLHCVKLNRCPVVMEYNVIHTLHIYMLFSYILCRQYSHPGLSTVSTVSRIRASQQSATTRPSFTRPEAKVQCGPSECGVFDDQSDPNQKIVALLGV